ncbi:MAG: hypothetical protein LBJ13_03555 [Puniceicoccales bacterium]|jgi:hypothetical protein|nr:hypothetical protein [Puniceicoccales bacterium]
MSGVNNRHNLDNISRPKNGQIELPNGLSTEMAQISKPENFHAMQRLLGEAINKNDRINDQAMEHFFNNISGKLTTNEELGQAIDVAKQFAQHPEVLSEHAQQLVLDIAQKIGGHRNADYSVAKKSKEIISETAKHLPKNSDATQNKFFQTIDFFGNMERNPKWNVDLFSSISKASQHGMEDIAEIAQSPYIRFIGNTASQVNSMAQIDQEQFQKAAIRTMRKTQFPVKFDADSFREALSVIQENIRTAEYKEQFAELGKKFPLPSNTTKDQGPSAYAPPPDKVTVTPIEILPQALPIVPESLQTAKHNGHDDPEEVEKNLVTAQAE